MRYQYLLPYMAKNYKGRIIQPYENRFYPIQIEEIENSEEILGFKFPDELREFYIEIGYGQIVAPHYPPPSYDFYDENAILHPLVVSEFRQGNLWQEDYARSMLEETYEYLTPNDLPFFEEGDSSRFLIMLPHSENPNAVWTTGHVKIEDSFERFVHRLYYEGPDYYYRDKY